MSIDNTAVPPSYNPGLKERQFIFRAIQKFAPEIAKFVPEKDLTGSPEACGYWLYLTRAAVAGRTEARQQELLAPLLNQQGGQLHLSPTGVKAAIAAGQTPKVFVRVDGGNLRSVDIATEMREADGLSRFDAELAKAQKADAEYFARKAAREAGKQAA